MEKNDQTVYSVGIATNIKFIQYLKIEKIIKLIANRSELIDSCFIRKNTKNDNRFVTICETSSEDNYKSVLSDLLLFLKEEDKSEIYNSNMRLVIGIFLKKNQFSSSVHFDNVIMKTLTDLNINLSIDTYPWTADYSE
jgi:hypothetical protein